MNQENNFNSQGNNGMPNNQPLNQNQVVGYDSQTGQPIYASQNNSLDDKLLMAFIGNNYEKIMQQKFSIPALFLSWIYTLYRRIYIPSIIGMVAIILLGFLPSIIYTIIVFAFVIVLGINFNKWYVAYAKKQVEKIKMSNQNINENELINICKKKGGTNIWLAILIYAIFAIVSGFLNPNLNNFYNSEDSYYSKVDLLSKGCLGDKNNAQAYIEQNVVKIKYDFGSGKSGQIDLGINNPKKLYRMSTNSCDLGTLIVLTEEKDAYAISFKSNKNEITMGNLIKFNKKVNEVRFLGNQMNIEFKYEDNTTESFTHAKIEYECDSCSLIVEDKKLQEYIDNVTQYGDKIKIVNSIKDLNAVSEYKNQYYNVDSIDNMKKYSDELFDQLLIGLKPSNSIVNNIKQEEIINLFLIHFGTFVDELYSCYKKDFVSEQISNLYDYKLDKDVTTIYTQGDYYCLSPGGGAHPGELTNYEYNFDGVYHVYNYEWTNPDNTVENYIIKFIEKDNLYKLYSIVTSE